MRSIFGSRKKNIEIKKQQLQNLIISVYQHSAMFFLSSVTSVLQKKRNVSRFPKLKKSFKTMKWLISSENCHMDCFSCMQETWRLKKRLLLSIFHKQLGHSSDNGVFYSRKWNSGLKMTCHRPHKKIIRPKIVVLGNFFSLLIFSVFLCVFWPVFFWGGFCFVFLSLVCLETSLHLFGTNYIKSKRIKKKKIPI